MVLKLKDVVCIVNDMLAQVRDDHPLNELQEDAFLKLVQASIEFLLVVAYGRPVQE